MHQLAKHIKSRIRVWLELRYVRSQFRERNDFATISTILGFLTIPFVWYVQYGEMSYYTKRRVEAALAERSIKANV